MRKFRARNAIELALMGEEVICKSNVLSWTL